MPKSQNYSFIEKDIKPVSQPQPILQQPQPILQQPKPKPISQPQSQSQPQQTTPPVQKSKYRSNMITILGILGIIVLLNIIGSNPK